MARAPVALQKGFLYQAYYFWLNAARMFQSQSKVKLVGYEINGAKAFDDVHVEYTVPRRCCHGGSIESDFFSLKFHVTQNGSIGYQDLIDPGFIGARKISFLQRLHDLCKTDPEFAKKSCFQLYTPWTINSADPLAELVSNNEGELRIDKIQSARGPKSKLGQVKDAWKKHLKISDDKELYATLRPLRIRHGDDLDKLRQAVSDALHGVGLKPIDFERSGDEYPTLIFQLAAEGRDKFTRDQLFEELKRDNLVVGEQPSTPKIKTFALRSFSREYEFLEDLSEQILALEGYFEGRFISDKAGWNGKLKDDLMTFVAATLTPKNSPIELYLDAHSSIVFAAGSLVSLKDRVNVAPIQKTKSGELVWKASDNPKAAEKLKAESIKIGEGPEVAVCLNITRPALNDVKKFLAASLPQVSAILVLQPASGPSQDAVKNGDHAWVIAEDVAAHLSELRSNLDPEKPIHFFNAAPNGVLFFLGRMSAPAGKLNLYEFDFERKRHGSYELSISLPWK